MIKFLTQITRIIFWEPCTSPHKSDFFSAVAKLSPNIEVICCADSELQLDRKAQGWSIKPTEGVHTLIALNATEIDALVREQVASTLHIFSGIRWVPSIVAGLKSVRKHGAKFSIMSEPRVAEGWKGKLRFVQSWLTESWLRKHTEFVLAQGRNGPPWFTSAGYSVERVFPFAYFIDPPKQKNELDSVIEKDKLTIQIGYVGRLVKSKGVFDVVTAISKLGRDAHLSIVGSGPEGQTLKSYCANLQIDAKFLGVLPISEVGQFMQDIDVLVLASTTKDGWGVVVSEALMSGTAVIATTCVGASIMLDNQLFGLCVPAEAPGDIAHAINKLHAMGAFTKANRMQRATMARQCLSAESGAQHLLDIIQWRFADAKRPAPFYKIGDVI